MPEGIVSHRDFNQPPEKIPTIGSIQRDFVQPGSRFEKISREHNLMLEISIRLWSRVIFSNLEVGKLRYFVQPGRKFIQPAGWINLR